jgi:Protein of unknown function (DUF3489)
LAKEDNMLKLTDSQLIMLSTAAARDDGAAVAPQGMGKAAAAKVGSSLVARKLLRELRSKPGMPIWRKNHGKNVTLVITRAGRDAIAVGDDMTAPDRPTAETVGASAAAKAPPAKTAAQAEPRTIDGAPRPGSKQALVVEMLCADDGASLDGLVKATGWLPHTTRAALTGLRKKGFLVERVRDESKGSLYRIVEKPGAAIGA